jgi:hypothetical protein
MKHLLTTVTVVALTAGSLVGARTLRQSAQTERGKDPLAAAPFAPTPAAAPFASLGYRELTADLLSLRLVGYFAGTGDDANVTAQLVEAIAALDPRYRRIYEFGARAITLAETSVNNQTYLRAIAVLEAGAKQFSEDWKLPYLASQIYLQDLVTDDKAQQSIWDDRGLLLLESALRKPNAPSDAAASAAVMRTKLGQTQRAANELREMLLVTSDKKAQQQLIQRLADLQAASADEVAAEVLEQRNRFEREWKRQRPGLPPTMYVIVGDKPAAAFDLGLMATGGRALLDVDRKPSD